MMRTGDLPQPSRQRSLMREVAWALALKAIALALIYFAFFGPTQKVALTPDRVAAKLIYPAPSRARP